MKDKILAEKYIDIIDNWQRKFDKYFPKSSDITLVVLKGHLLIEENINVLIAKHCWLPENIKKANLQSEQKIKIAQALSHFYAIPYFWQSITSLNSLRNELAHNLDSDKIRSKALSFVAYRYKSQNKEFKTQYIRTKRRLVAEVKSSLAYLLGQLSMIDSVDPLIVDVRYK